MTTQEKRPLVFLLIDVITYSIYFTLLLNYHQPYSNTMGDVPFWSASLLILIPLMMASRILFYLLYSVINTLITKEAEEKFLIDELLEVIKLKAARNFNTTFMFGFVVTLVLLTMGLSTNAMFKMFYLSIFAAFVVQNTSEYYYVKKGL